MAWLRRFRNFWRNLWDRTVYIEPPTDIRDAARLSGYTPDMWRGKDK